MLDINSIFLLIVLGSFVGIIAGLLGIGGAGIAVPILTTMFIMDGLEVEKVVHIALATSLATVAITSFSSLRAHNKRNGVLWDIVKIMTPGVIIGSLIATYIMTKLNALYLSIFFTIFMAYMAIQMFLDIKPKPSRKFLPARIQYVVSVLIGGISAMVSIGGGVINVPYLTWQNIDLKKAIGTSATIGFPIAISGTIGHIINGWDNTNLDAMMLGYIYLPAFFLISVCSFFTAPIGVKLAHTLPIKTIKKIFAFFLLAMSIKMLTSILGV